MKIAILIFALAAVGCTTSTSSSSTSTTDGKATGSVDSALVGQWYAGRGGTMIAYDESTGSFGAPSGTGMMFVFHADGTYQKAFQSIESGACTVGFVTVESGVATTASGEVRLHPSSGTMHEISCSGSADNDHAITVSDESLAYALEAEDALRLTDTSTGAASEFRRTN